MDPSAQNTYMKEQAIVGTKENLVSRACSMHVGGILEIKDFGREFSGHVACMLGDVRNKRF
jgi:hypothetical protein